MPYGFGTVAFNRLLFEFLALPSKVTVHPLLGGEPVRVTGVDTLVYSVTASGEPLAHVKVLKVLQLGSIFTVVLWELSIFIGILAPRVG